MRNIIYEKYPIFCYVFCKYWTDSSLLKKIDIKEELTMDNDDIVHTIYIPNLS